jgi:serine/threonine-protein kinase
MGEVYLARRRAAGVEKWLVVKRMRPERAGDPRFMDLFKREAMLSMSLAHQNIVPVFDFGRIDDQVFLAMERVEGKDLGSTITKAGKPLPPLLAAFIAAECCQALDYAHHRKGPDGAELKIVHRDVTPRNVLLSWSGEVKLTDFGIAALAGDDPSQSKMAGTPAYMAPEQARAEPLDARADVYAVGMVLREALTGERPRRGADREATIAAAKTGVIDPWPEGFDSPLKTIIDKATAANKDDRYAGARSMADDLDEFMMSERAAKKGDTPARLLAAWLADIWQGEQEEQQTFDGKIEAGELMSFMDDGALDALGTGTQRSMLATAAEQTPPAGVPIMPDLAATESSAAANADAKSAKAKADDAISAKNDDSSAKADDETRAKRDGGRRAKTVSSAPPRRWPLVVALVAMTGAAIAFAIWPRGQSSNAGPEKLDSAPRNRVPRKKVPPNKAPHNKALPSKVPRRSSRRRIRRRRRTRKSRRRLPTRAALPSRRPSRPASNARSRCKRRRNGRNLPSTAEPPSIRRPTRSSSHPAHTRSTSRATSTSPSTRRSRSRSATKTFAKR